MSSFTGNAIISKAKSIYGRRLTPADYESLMQKRSVPDIASYLRNHPNYEGVLSGIQPEYIHRGQLEELIKKNNFANTLRLIKFAKVKDISFYHLNLVKREIDILQELLRSMISESFDTQVTDIPHYMKQHASFDIYKASHTRSIDELLSVLQKTPYHKVLYPFRGVANKDINYVEIEHAFELFLYDTTFQRIDENYRGKTRDALRTMYLTKIELGNIVKIYRLKKFYKADFSTIKRLLIHQYSRLSERKIDELIQVSDPDAILRYLDGTEFSKYIDANEYVYIEYFAEKIKYHLAKRYMYFSCSVPEIYAAYLLLGEIENENLTNIIEGIRYSLSEAEIRKMLIY